MTTASDTTALRTPTPTPPPHLVRSGAAMDEIVPQDGRRKLYLGVAAGALLVLALAGLWRLMPRGLQVPAADVHVEPVVAGVFYDNVVLRAKAGALNSIVLDAVDAGRVEQVLASDGALVKKGDLLFRISNPQRSLELLQRQSELAQQISNLSSQKVDYESGKSEHERRVEDIDYNLAQAAKKLARDQGMAAQNFISVAALTESADAVDRWQLQRRKEMERDAVETSVKRSAMAQLERAVRRIEQGLALVSATVDALAVHAPAAGRLTDFNLQVGSTIKTDQHIGRIDDPSQYKLIAQVDEFYLNRMRVGLAGSVKLDGRDHPLQVTRILPQVTDGRFTMELGFKDAQPSGVSPGQSLDIQVLLGEPKQALLLPNAPFLNDSGGAWAYVLGTDDASAERRPIRIGRRNNSHVEVVSGLAAGERVIVSSYAGFNNAQRVQLKR